MQNELDVVRDLSEKLAALKIPFMLTGSLAMNYYATPRMTRGYVGHWAGPLGVETLLQELLGA